ncbi:hypothetical protein [Thermogemmatispora sp.]|jgi:hypothetical protein|uniref:hypothetical protein n=1 Tax=Thermogemmatispora sp. TaxID=1968838 RepID=UPI0035E408D0
MSDTQSNTQSHTQSSITSGAQSESVAQRPAVANEERRAFGTAKTESLRDSGWWRIVIPAFVVVASAALFVVPLVLLITLLATTSLNTSSAVSRLGIPLGWLWIVMIVIEVAIAALIARGLLKIFLTDAGNYRA